MRRQRSVTTGCRGEGRAMSSPMPSRMAVPSSASVGSRRAWKPPMCASATPSGRTSSDLRPLPVLDNSVFVTRRTLMDIAAIGRQFGLDETQTRAALDALAPVVAAGVRRTAQSPEGLQDIFSSVLTGGHGRAFEDQQAVTFDTAKSTGDDILGQIFGNKDVSREVAERVSTTSGVGSDILKKLLL